MISVEMRHTFYRSVPLITSLDIAFHSHFKNAILALLKSFFQLDHQVDIGLYVTHATAHCYSRELAFSTQS